MKIGDPAMDGFRARTKREEFFLRMARLLWHDVLDSACSIGDNHVRRELFRLLKLAKATTKDL